VGYAPCKGFLKLWQAPGVSARAMATTDVSQMSLEAKVALLGCLCQSQVPNLERGSDAVMFARGELNLDKSTDQGGALCRS